MKKSRKRSGFVSYSYFKDGVFRAVKSMWKGYLLSTGGRSYTKGVLFERLHHVAEAPHVNFFESISRGWTLFWNSVLRSKNPKSEIFLVDWLANSAKRDIFEFHTFCSMEHKTFAIQNNWIAPFSSNRSHNKETGRRQLDDNNRKIKRRKQFNMSQI